MRAVKVQASLRIRAVSPEPPLLAHTSSESRGTFRQKARSLAPLNGWACAVTICHDGMLEDTNSLDGAQMMMLWFTVEINIWQNNQNDWVPSKNSEHPPSLIRVFTVRIKKAIVLSYPLSKQRRLIRPGGCPGWSESSLVHSHVVGFVMRRLK